LEDFVTGYVYCVLQRDLLIWGRRGGSVSETYIYIYVMYTPFIYTMCE